MRLSLNVNRLFQKNSFGFVNHFCHLQVSTPYMKKIFVLIAILLGLTAAKIDAETTEAKSDKKPAKSKSEKKAGAKKPEPKSQSDDKKNDKKKEEEKPSPPPSGPQDDGAFHKTILDSDEKVGDKYEDTLKDPMELAVANDGRVFFVERAGVLKMWHPSAKKSVEVGKLKVFNELEDGLLGIALDPKFMENNWIYLNHSLPETGKSKDGKKTGVNRISRFTLVGDKLDLQSEKTIIDIPTQREQCCHAGGSLAFDAQGNLYISTGDNTNPFDSDGFSPIDQRKDRSPWDAQKSSANADDLRGKILRIHPEPEGGYTIPKGNLFANKHVASSGTPQKGAEQLAHPSTATSGAVRTEIYVMGCRNPFRISIDKKNGYLYWGDVGPDAKEFKESRGPAGMDEVNQARQAGNFGWPYFIGENKAYWIRDFKLSTNTVFKAKFDPAKPSNRSPNNTGLKRLPPAQPAMIFYPHGPSAKFPVVNGDGGRTAMGGPVYYFDSVLKSDHKLPSELDHTLFIYDWSRSWVIKVQLDREDKIAKMERFCPKMTFKRPMDMELGPDGCLYIIEWGSAWGNNKDTQIVRIEYNPDKSDKLAGSTAAK